jgi:hypothetical protein
MMKESLIKRYHMFFATETEADPVEAEADPVEIAKT